jgi:Arc/MetJ-type ribon-helix-helix transcriptional regulator
MKREFMDLAANSIIPTFPGQTAQWIAGEALAHDSELSDAKNPIVSLANTLSKQVQTGREKRIRRERISGIYRYSPASGSFPSDSIEGVIVQLPLSMQELKDIDNLVAVDKFHNRSDAIKWLVMEGITANRGYLDKVADTRNQIEQLKREVGAE